jgi:DNA-binding ferritin-like protein
MGKTRFNKSNYKSTNSKKTKRTMRKTKRNRGVKSVSNEQKSHLVRVFFDMLNTVKLYHWKTHSYAQHKATDELYGRLNENIDKFVEVLLGKDESRIRLIENKIIVPDYSRTSDFKRKIYGYRNFLIDMNHHLDQKQDTDLLSIRDDILVDINQFLYLMTFE